ncbi:hypothetical protein [Psychroserpens luteolus]|uniref:hypothetical protein n=1 Tax=Psychroserpens luteolus TaxID=2855840 RepID=UPI001E4E80FE|nr:hypothetical protein [Psychroserpens luteolus]MCD2259502.1 hypothetical protein [Psychroserpens luteolus]
MKIFKKYIALILLILLVSCNDVNEIPLKSNIEIQIDGLLREKDWEDSKIITLKPSTTLFYIEDEVNLFIGIRNTDSINRYIDLYINNDSIGTINLHASMQLGERLLGDHWNDTIPTWDWGNNKDWISNNVEIVNHNENMSFQESIAPYEGFEFKILKRKIKSKKNRIRIEIKDFLGEAQDIVYPLDSERNNKENWNTINIKSQMINEK